MFSIHNAALVTKSVSKQRIQKALKIVHERTIKLSRCLSTSNTNEVSSYKPARSKKITSLTLSHKKRKSQKITMVTAYDYPSALHVDRAGIDVLLVGDSCAMVELGYPTTQPITMTEMLHHCKAVHRGIMAGDGNGPLLVADMPLGTYELNPETSLKNAYQFIKEAGMDAVKLEGGTKSRAETVQKITQDGGIAVMGHVGLTPQAISVIGGFRAQGRTAKRAREILDDALRLQDAGAFALVLECVPGNVAKIVTETLEIPIIGIGAGGDCDGQVLVYHDMLGMSSHPHHEQFVPRFCKSYANVGNIIQNGLESFKNEVESSKFPGEGQYSPYHMPESEQIQFEQLLKQDEGQRRLYREKLSKELKDKDEYEAIGLYGPK